MLKPLLVLAISLAFARGVAAQEPTLVRVNIFPTASYIGTYVGVAHGMFARHGLKVEVQVTPNSQAQRDGLAGGKFEVAHAAVDNAVAMAEVAKHDVIIVTGGDSGLNEFMVRPEIGSLADIRGKILVVDAPNTAYALVAKKILKNGGLLEGRDYKLREIGGTHQRIEAMEKDPTAVSGMLNPPFSFSARDKGMKSLGYAIDLIGPYQAGGAFVMRSWARANPGVLDRYVAGYIEAVRFVLAPANRAQVVALLVTHLKQEQKVAERTYDALVDPRSGMAKDARFDIEGFKAVLARSGLGRR